MNKGAGPRVSHLKDEAVPPKCHGKNSRCVCARTRARTQPTFSLLRFSHKHGWEQIPAAARTITTRNVKHSRLLSGEWRWGRCKRLGCLDVGGHGNVVLFRVIVSNVHASEREASPAAGYQLSKKSNPVFRMLLLVLNWWGGGGEKDKHGMDAPGEIKDLRLQTRGSSSPGKRRDWPAIRPPPSLFPERWGCWKAWTGCWRRTSHPGRC